MKALRILLPLLLMLHVAPAGSAQVSYGSFKTGRLEGKLLVQWIEPDKFIFTPDAGKPLTFTRSNGQKVVPGRMLTDGGSIPRPLWILRSYSPWGYAPAFIVHDWLFNAHHCGIQLPFPNAFDQTGIVMAEVMKTMMETKVVEVDKLTLISMYTAVSSPIAKRHWDTGKCDPAPADLEGGRLIREFVLEYPPKQ